MIGARQEELELLPRVLPTPPHVQRYLRRYRPIYPSGDCFNLSDYTDVPPFHLMQNILSAINASQRITENLSASDLRSAFVRRCFQSGMNLYSLCVYIGIKQPNVVLKRYCEYFSPKLDGVQRLERYAADYVPPEQQSVFAGSKRMNLLILGAGSQGAGAERKLRRQSEFFTRLRFWMIMRKTRGALALCPITPN